MGAFSASRLNQRRLPLASALLGGLVLASGCVEAHGNVPLGSPGELIGLFLLFLSGFIACVVAPLFAERGSIAVRIAKGFTMAFANGLAVYGVFWLAGMLAGPRGLPLPTLALEALGLVMPWIWPATYLFRHRENVARVSRRLSEAAERDV